MPAPVTLPRFERDRRIADPPAPASAAGPVTRRCAGEPEARSRPDAGARQRRLVAESEAAPRAGCAGQGARLLVQRNHAGFTVEAERIVARRGSRHGSRDRPAAPRRRRADPRRPGRDV